MADLYKHNPDDPDIRRDWIRWAIEFVRRGLWPDDVITVHGPHDFHGFWCNDNEAIACERDDNGKRVYIVFYSYKSPRSKYDVRDVRFFSAESDCSKSWPILKKKALSKNARRWLRVAEKMRGRRRRG